VLPLLESRLPDLDRRLTRLARWARENRAGWDAVLELLPLGMEAEPGKVSLLTSALTSLPDSLASQLLQAAARRAGLVVGPVAASRLLSLIRRGESGQRVDLGGGLCGEIAFQRVVVAAAPPAPSWDLEITGEAGDAAVDGWRCRWSREPAPSRQDRTALVAWFDPATSYQVRPWRPGDRILPLGGTGHRLIVRCMQDRRVPRRDRAGWPVLVGQGVPVWVPGVMRSALALPGAGQPALRLEFTRAPAPAK
jgi:tRNA(Ile)-lysidine synthase